MQNNLTNITNYINDAFTLAKDRKMDNAVEHFFTVRMLLRTSIVEGKTSQQTLHNHTNIFKSEAQKFKNAIHENQPNINIEKEIVIVGDSLHLPRPEETKSLNGGIDRTTSYMLQGNIKKENAPYGVNTWAQRYFTTDSLIAHWEEIIPLDLKNCHLVIHLGLNDYVERMFLEEERLAMELYPEELKVKIVQFAQQYRKEIIHRQLNHSYVPFEKFKKNICEIITKAKKVEVLSLTLVNIIALPSYSWGHTPRSMWNTSRFNMFLYDVEQEYTQVNILDLDRLIWEQGLHEHLLSDKMHLSLKGHKLLADQLFKIL